MMSANNKDLVDEISKPLSDKASVLVFHPRGKRLHGVRIRVVKIDSKYPAVLEIVLCRESQVGVQTSFVNDDKDIA